MGGKRESLELSGKLSGCSGEDEIYIIVDFPQLTIIMSCEFDIRLGQNLIVFIDC